MNQPPDRDTAFEVFLDKGNQTGTYQRLESLLRADGNFSDYNLSVLVDLLREGFNQGWHDRKVLDMYLVWNGRDTELFPGL